MTTPEAKAHEKYRRPTHCLWMGDSRPKWDEPVCRPGGGGARIPSRFFFVYQLVFFISKMVKRMNCSLTASRPAKRHGPKNDGSMTYEAINTLRSSKAH